MRSTRATRSGPLSVTRTFSVVGISKGVTQREGDISKVELTYDIVPKLVADETGQWAVAVFVLRRQVEEDFPSVGFRPELDTLLDHIAGKFVPRVHDHMGDDGRDHLRPVLLLPILNHMLNHVIAELIRDELRCACVKLLEDGPSIIFATMLQHPLDDPAPVRVGGKFVHLSLEGVDDELHMLGRNPFDRLLDDMVAVLVPHTAQHGWLQLLDHRCLLVGEDVFQGLPLD